uniref:ABC transporter domain-containing protein n=1 Tax=Ditylenchus dipsaci TaxID=166011 RepID=A0A915DK30_9BILA
MEESGSLEAGETTTLLLRSSSKHSSKRSSVLSHGELELSQLYGSSMSRKRHEITPLGLSWHNLSVTHVKSNHKILDNVCGVVEPGQFVALMGSSGAGKPPY